MILSRFSSTATILGSLLFCAAANASFTLNITQRGGNVVAAGTGTLDLAGLTYAYASPSGSIYVWPVAAQILTGVPDLADVYAGVVGPASFGLGVVPEKASSGSGDVLGVDGSDSLIAVPSGYVSGTALSSSATWDNATIASLGLVPGTYTFSWDDNGVVSDTFVINIGNVSTPEPASIALLLGVGTLAGFGARKRFTKITVSRP